MRIRFLMGSLVFYIDLILPGSNKNGGGGGGREGGQCVGLTTMSPSCADCL